MVQDDRKVRPVAKTGSLEDDGGRMILRHWSRRLVVDDGDGHIVQGEQSATCFGHITSPGRRGGHGGDRLESGKGGQGECGQPYRMEVVGVDSAHGGHGDADNGRADTQNQDGRRHAAECRLTSSNAGQGGVRLLHLVQHHLLVAKGQEIGRTLYEINDL